MEQAASDGRRGFFVGAWKRREERLSLLGQREPRRGAEQQEHRRRGASWPEELIEHPAEELCSRWKRAALRSRAAAAKLLCFRRGSAGAARSWSAAAAETWWGGLWGLVRGLSPRRVPRTSSRELALLRRCARRGGDDGLPLRPPRRRPRRSRPALRRGAAMMIGRRRCCHNAGGRRAGDSDRPIAPCRRRQLAGCAPTRWTRLGRAQSWRRAFAL